MNYILPEIIDVPIFLKVKIPEAHCILTIRWKGVLKIKSFGELVSEMGPTSIIGSKREGQIRPHRWRVYRTVYNL